MNVLLALGAVFVFFVFVAIILQSESSKGRATALAAIDGFDPAVRYEGSLGLPGLALNPVSSRFAIMRGAEVKLFNFSDLIAVEVEQNGGSISRTNRGSQATGAVVGGLLLGPAGFLVGGLSGRRTTTDLVKRLSLKLFTSDLVHPVHEIVFFKDGQGKPTDSIFVRRAAERLDQWHGRFRTILVMQERGSTPQPAVTEIVPMQPEPSIEQPALIEGPLVPRKSWLGRTFGA